MRHFFILALVACFGLTSCSSDEPGPRGPEGPQGPQGPPGDALISTIFEIEGDFTEDNQFSLLATYSDFTDVEVFESDVVQVYLLAAQQDDASGAIDVWRALPNSYFESGGTVVYNYDFTFFDVNIFLDSDLDLSSLGPEYTEDQVFRVAIIPAEVYASKNMDLYNLNEVMNTLEIQESQIQKLELR